MDLEAILLVTFSLDLDLTTESSDVNKREMQQLKLGWNSPQSVVFAKTVGFSKTILGVCRRIPHMHQDLTLPETCSSLVQQVDVLSTQNVG